MIKTVDRSEFTLEQMRAAEDMLLNLEQIYYSLTKLSREYTATVRISGPDGYPDHSSECTGISKQCNMSAEQTLGRLDELKKRYDALSDMLLTLKSDLLQIRGTRIYKLLYLRFKLGYSAQETAQKMGASLRNYYRIRKAALLPVCQSLNKTELGRRVLASGSKVAIHKYFK